MRSSFAVVFVFVAGTAFAQTPEGSPDASTSPKRTRLQLGAAVDVTTMPGGQTSSSVGPALLWRWRGRFSRADDRWGFAYRFSTLDSQISSTVGVAQLPVADIKMRPLMAGVEYRMPRGRWNWAAGVSAGWAFNSVDTPGEYRVRALNTAGVSDLSVDVHDSLAWGPRLKGWYDINSRVSLLVESSYLVIRPTLDVQALGASSSRKLKGDAFVVKAGIAYGIF